MTRLYKSLSLSCVPLLLLLCPLLLLFFFSASSLFLLVPPLRTHWCFFSRFLTHVAASSGSSSSFWFVFFFFVSYSFLSHTLLDSLFWLIECIESMNCFVVLNEVLSLMCFELNQWWKKPYFSGEKPIDPYGFFLFN